MHIDIFSAVIFNITSSFLMGLSLFFVARGHLGEIAGIKRWATGLFFQFLGWTLLLATKVFSEWISIAPLATSIIILSLAFYYQALVKFKGVTLNTNWTYYVALLDFAGLLYFDIVNFNINSRMIVTAFFSFIFIAAMSYLLLSTRFNSSEKIPTSHKMMGYIFAVCSTVLIARIIYFSVFPTRDVFALNIMQSLSYVMFHVVISFTAFGFLLMCSERYVELQRETENRLLQRTQELEIANQKLAKLSFTDGLTGIANRRHFDEMLDFEWERAKRQNQILALGLLDVDWFKKYNDCYGHQMGDECLKQVAKVLTENVSRTGDLVARYGGEEFVFVLSATDGDTALRIAQKICLAFEKLELPHELSDFNFVSVSIGVAAIVPSENFQTKDLIQRADKALYIAKKQGRNQAVTADSI
jgi:diguanylate cyclase (GGDEF)-like protein